MKRFARPAVLAAIGALALTTCAEPLRADAAADYQALFGADEKKVAATRQTADDAAFADKLVQGAKALADSPKLQALLWQKAWAFGRKAPAGYAHALAAVERLLKADKDNQAKWRDKRVELLAMLYTRSRGTRRKEIATTYVDALLSAAEALAEKGSVDRAVELYARALPVARYTRSPRLAEIAARRKELAGRAAVLRRLQVRIDRLKASLAKDAKATELRQELVLCYLLEADLPGKAAACVTEDLPEAFRTYVPLAAKPISEVAEPACLELAAWLAELAEKASQARQVNALLRARVYYGRFLRLHTQRDTTVLKARLALDQVEKHLKRLGAAVIPASEWIELLKYVDPDKHGKGGKWQREDGVLVGSAAIFNRITIPVSPRGDYSVRVAFSRHRGGSNYQAFFVIFPVGNTQAAFMIDGQQGKAAGLSSVRGKLLASGTTPYEQSLLKINTPHAVEVHVKHDGRTAARIVCKLDGKEIVAYRGPWSALSTDREILRKDCIGVGSYWSKVFLRSVKLYMPSGKPRVYK